MKQLTKNDLMSLEIRAASQGEQIVISREDFEALVHGYNIPGDKSKTIAHLKGLVYKFDNIITALKLRNNALEQNLKDAIKIRRNERKK